MYLVDNFSMTKCLQNSKMILRRMSNILPNIKKYTTFILSKIRWELISICEKKITQVGCAII